MADDTVVIESKADQATQAKALAIGWIPPTRFKGDPERFVDADQYIARGEELLPIVKANNKHLQQQVETQHSEIASLRAAVAKSEEAIAAMELRHSAETQRKVEQARAEVKAQLAKASADGDHEGVAELTDQLTQLNTAEKDAKAAEKKEEPKKEEPAKFIPSAAMQAFVAENPWFGTDKRKTNLMLVEVASLRESPEGKGMSEADLYEAASESVLAMTGEKKPPVNDDKVEGSRGGGNRSGSKTYAGLPADAKAACDADQNRFVGKGKKFADAAAYRAHWASIYHAE